MARAWVRMRLNTALYSEDGSFYISFNPGNWDTPAFASDDGGAETAIVHVVNGRDNYLILNGDHRVEYEKLIDKGLIACIQYFESKPDLKSGWSN